ncbi:MAG: hypothetical protein IJ471_05330 [Eubacterium sp.]|nr:hypothetical protein [Eubacterium sp.]
MSKVYSTYTYHTSTRGYVTPEYVYGNAVRVAAPELEPQKSPQRKPVRTPEQEQRLRQRKAAAKKNQQRAMVMNGKFVLFLAAATLVCAIFCGLFVMMQADITTNMKNITALETQISTLKIENDALEKRLDTTVNLEDIKAEALALGMTYPAEEQIVTYSVEQTDYMNQFSAIP